LIRKIANTARDYAWGSTSLIPDYFGIAETDKPMAEIWFGTHSGSPTMVVGEAKSLLDLREGAQLPFLLKILAAGQPLSIQAHPNKEQAMAGFARESAAGIPIDAPNRDYKDDHHKPEMIVALTPFTALVGFRERVDIVVSFQRLAMQAQQLGLDALEEALASWIQLLRDGGTPALFQNLLEQRGALDEVCAQLSDLASSSRAIDNIESANLALVPLLQELHPGDPGVVISQMLNLVELAPMQAAELLAGNVHAYVSGLGVEIMANSDNVLRGGLTTKNINTSELLKIVDFKGSSKLSFEAERLLEGLWRYPTMAEDYILYRLEVSGSHLMADLEIPNPAIVLCTAGEIAVGDSLEHREVLRKGEAASTLSVAQVPLFWQPAS
jgi:mannose-6-phosphate isomerase